MPKTSLLIFFFCASALSACSEAPLISRDVQPHLNRPGALALVPGTDFAIVANTNPDIREKSGSMIAVNMATKALVPESLIAIPSLAGRLAVDVPRSRVYVVDRAEDGLLIYQYSIPGPSGEPIAFAPVAAPTPIEKSANAVQTDNNPYDVYEAVGTPAGDLLFVTNLLDGSVSAIDADTLLPMDLNPMDGALNGLPLISSANFQSVGSRPGRGASRMTPGPDGTLLYVASTLTSQIYILDIAGRQVEGVLDLSGVSAAGGVRGIAVSTAGLAYVTHRGIGSVVVLDVSNIHETGDHFRVISPTIVDIIPTGHGVDGIALSSDETKVFVTDNLENTLTVIDTAKRAVDTKFLLGALPAEIVPDAARGVMYVLNLLSDSISVIDQTTLSVETIQ
ncbi:MAG: YncE family protein [Pseudomonadota bacterium]